MHPTRPRAQRRAPPLLGIAASLAAGCSSASSGNDATAGSDAGDTTAATTDAGITAGPEATGTDPSGEDDDTPTSTADTTTTPDTDTDASSGTDGGDTSGTPEPAAPDCAMQECTGDWLWARRWGEEDASGVQQLGRSQITDVVGNTTFVTTLDGATDFGAAGTVTEPGQYLVRVDTEGTAVWVTPIQSVNVIRMAIAEDDVLALTMEPDLVPRLWAVDPEGELTVLAEFPAITGQVLPYDFALAEDGTIAIAGRIDGMVDFGGDILTSDGQDAFVVVLATDLGHLWSRRFGASAGQYATGVGFGPAGEILLTGLNSGTIGFGNTVHVANASGSSPWIAALEPNAGEELWSRQFAGEQSPDLRLFAEPDGFILATDGTGQEPLIDFGNGALAGHVHVARFDEVGDVLWARTYPSRRGVEAYVRDGATGLLMVGYLDEPVDFGDGEPLVPYGAQGDGFVVKLHIDDGAVTWARRLGDDDLHDNRQRFHGVSVDAAGNVYAGGEFAGTFDVGFGDVTAGQGALGSDLMLAKLRP